MESTWNSGLNIQQGNLLNENGLPSSAGFSFIDFLPECREDGGFFGSPVFETFRSMMDRANGWLQANRNWKVATCESVEFKSRGTQIDYNKMTFTSYGDNHGISDTTSYVRGLRLWLTAQLNPTEKEQQIGFLNMLPQKLDSGGIFSEATFETLDVVIQKFNLILRNKPIPGRILNIETQGMKVPSFDNLDADRSNWKEKGSEKRKFLFVLRIFYEIMDGMSPEDIGLKDFVPDQIKKAGIFSSPKYEPFSHVIAKASAWCSQQSGLRFCNAQSLEMKVKRGEDVDTQKMNYTEYAFEQVDYVTILRVAYTKMSGPQFIPDKPPFVRELTCRTFVPMLKSAVMFSSEYEDLQATRERVMAWVRATGAHVLSAETTAIKRDNNAIHGTDTSFYRRTTQTDEYWIFIIRLYLNGVYREPPPEMLPPVPVIEEQECCTIL